MVWNDWRHSALIAGRQIWFGSIGGISLAAIAYSAIASIYAYWELASRVVPVLKWRRAPAQPEVFAVDVRVLLLVMICLGLLLFAAAYGFSSGLRRASDPKRAIPTDHLALRLMIIVHFILLWLVTIQNLFNGMGPPEPELGLSLGGISVLLSLAMWYKRMFTVAGYLIATGFLLCIISGVPQEQGVIGDLLFGTVFLAFTVGTGYWAWRLLSRSINIA